MKKDLFFVARRVAVGERARARLGALGGVRPWGRPAAGALGCRLIAWTREAADGCPRRSPRRFIQTTIIQAPFIPNDDYSPVWSSIGAPGAFSLTEAIPFSAPCLET